MSSTIRAPWIHDYLVQIAEEHGGNLISLAPETKARKGQLIKWLTYPRADDEDVFLWAIISDKVHSVHVRFSKEAVKTIKQNSIFAGRNVTTHKTSMITVKQFRPFMTRVPIGPTKGMSATDHIALDIEDFTLPGAFNEPAWGEPKPVELHPDIHEWVQGLRQAGGADNVLKLRKAAREQGQDASAPAHVDQPPGRNRQRPEVPLEVIPRRTKLVTRRSIPSRPVKPPSPPPEPAQPAAHVSLNPEQTYERKWKPFSANRRDLPVPDDIKAKVRTLPFTQLVIVGDGLTATSPGSAHKQDNTASKSAAQLNSPPRKRRRLDALDLGTSEPSSSASPASRHPEEREDAAELMPRTPSHWSPSNRGTPQADVAFLEDDDDDDDDGENHLDTEVGLSLASSPPASPSSRSRTSFLAQQDSGASKQNSTKAPTPPAYRFVTIPELTSSYLSAPTPGQRRRVIPSSSPLPPASAAQEVTVSAVYESPMPAPAASAPSFSSFHLSHHRRVPRPVCHRLSPDPNASGPGRILVPNSDTSASLSQDQPFSQQSQQIGSSSQLQSQQVGSSQLRSQQASSSQSQERSQEQNQKESRSQQSLSYATESQNSKSDPKSQGVRQSRLRTEVAVNPKETGEVQPVSKARTPDEATKTEPAPRAAAEVRSSSPARVLSPDTPDPRTRSCQPEATKGQGSSRQSISRPDSEPSEMVVDSESETDGEGDTGDEQDELESVTHGPAVASRRAPALESDDEQTRAMVNEYGSRGAAESAQGKPRDRPRQTSSTTDLVPGGPQKKDGSATRRRPLRKDGSTASRVNSDMPLPPSSPDVFSSDASFLASEGSSPPRDIIRSNKALLARTKARDPITPVRDTRQFGSTRGGAADTGSSDRTRVDKPPQPTHDPEAWKEPAFLRKPTPAQRGARPQKPKAVVPAKERVQQAKRVISISSDSEAEGPPAKKQKISTAAATRTSGWIQTQTLRPQPPKDTIVARRPTVAKPVAQADGRSAAPPAVVAKQLNLQRSASVVSSIQSVPRKRPSAGRSASPEKRGTPRPEVKVVRQLSPGGSTPVEVKHVDFAPGSRRSTSISAAKSRMSEAPGLHSRAPSVHRGQAHSSNHRALPLDGLPSAKQAMQLPATSNKESAKSTPASTSTDRRQQQSVASSSTSGSAGLSKETGPAPRVEPPLLGGYEVDFNEVYTEDGPQFVTWAGLRQILLNTGRAKHKLKVQQQGRVQ